MAPLHGDLWQLQQAPQFTDLDPPLVFIPLYSSNLLPNWVPYTDHSENYFVFKQL